MSNDCLTTSERMMIFVSGLISIFQSLYIQARLEKVENISRQRCFSPFNSRQLSSHHPNAPSSCVHAATPVLYPDNCEPC